MRLDLSARNLHPEVVSEIRTLVEHGDLDHFEAWPDDRPSALPSLFARTDTRAVPTAAAPLDEDVPADGAGYRGAGE